MKNHVTVAIVSYNGAEFIKKLIEGVLSQKTKRQIEILVIDSGSTDGTLEILKVYPKVRLHHIDKKDFSHGGTRNLAVEMAKGEYVLFLTQDAVPAHKYWLEAMIEPFEISDKVGCVVGKQVPLPDAPVTIKREVVSVFRGLGPDDSISLQRKNDITVEFKLVNTFMSDTNSAVRKDLHKKIPFRVVDYAEDQAMGEDILKNGYYKAYSPLGAVNHSHNFSVWEYYMRKKEEYVGLRQTMGHTATASYKEIIWGTSKATLRDWQFLLRDKEYDMRQKITYFFKAPGYNLAVRLAIRSAAAQK